MEKSKENAILVPAIQTTCATYASVTEMLGTVLMADMEAVAQELRVNTTSLEFMAIPNTCSA